MPCDVILYSLSPAIMLFGVMSTAAKLQVTLAVVLSGALTDSLSLYLCRPISGKLRTSTIMRSCH
jgi:hypothetical protein